MTKSKQAKDQKIIFKLNNQKNLKSIFYYSYDEMYFFLHELFISNNKIFLKYPK